MQPQQPVFIQQLTRQLAQRAAAPAAQNRAAVTHQVRRYLREIGKRGGATRAADPNKPRFDSATGRAAVLERWRRAREPKPGTPL